jgi:hypothetical protein
MEFALALVKLWRLRLWVAGGALLALLASFAVLQVAKSTTYAAAETSMLVDAPRSALGNTQADLTPLVTRAAVFARLMTSAEALNYIGRAAHIPGNLIAATGPEEIGTPQATHTPSINQNGKLSTPPASYSLRFDQNPLLPTVDVYATAPTANQAIALANGAVTGFATYVDQLELAGNVPAGQRVTIRQMGSATGGAVDSGIGTMLAAIVFPIVMIIWCFMVLLGSKLRGKVRTARRLAAEAPFESALEGHGGVDADAHWLDEGAADSTNGATPTGALGDALARSRFVEH